MSDPVGQSVATPIALPRIERWPLALSLIAATILARLAIAALVPLVPDEAYYALWSTRLAAGYLDHPPMIAWFIRGGTMIAGDTAFGVRLLPVLSAIPASFFVWRAAGLLLADRRAGPIAALLFNLTLLGFFGLAVATPDAPLILFSAATLYCAAWLVDHDRPVWWLAVGAATGLALLSKYSAAFLAAGFGVAVLLLPQWRRRLLGPWPWAALAVAILVFAPNLIWNATHGWETVAKQGGRTTENWQFEPQFLAEFFGAQLGLATPLIFLFGVIGLSPRCRPAWRSPMGWRLILALVLVPTAYFIFHALRSRVEGNWTGFLYPAFAVAAAAALTVIPAEGRSLMARLRRATVPVALGFVAFAALYATVVPTTALGTRDPILRLTRGWGGLASDIDTIRRASGATYILTLDYQLNAELARLLPDVPVMQLNEPERYAFLDRPVDHTTGTGLVVTRDPMDAWLKSVFGPVETLGTVTRQFRGVAIADYIVYRIERPAGQPLPVVSE
ncbi:Dolichyl-phosphate-mannose-protein mannosyltransferase [Kaistia soli DSM 19436]|uniref:Dolichyl-phosphate-mannose-protein mannosyltransferase n=1 Tax=Kaistia soli DSM 19436 TaxID=1122133 RepID=A0A1M5CRZ2_9HYPH|nr:glycosyltransferase family 39 protein [Kaistia soli]SHF57476.1 Dolichyl-phosphate-mannose-protein mannosyltransferase [Kaistia soli DSM 19436]